uniref:Uncharacterized protein n=1 Tax=Noccaea caerulescens TaxID=107243 RepID=A0A1J3CS04_NOCCA
MSLLFLPQSSSEYVRFPSFKQRSDSAEATDTSRVADAFSWTKSKLLQESPGELSGPSLNRLTWGDDELIEVDCELFDTAVCQKLVAEPLLTLSKLEKYGTIDSIPSPRSISHSVESCFLSFSVFDGLDMIKFSQSHGNGDLMLQSIQDVDRFHRPTTNARATNPQVENREGTVEENLRRSPIGEESFD